MCFSVLDPLRLSQTDEYSSIQLSENRQGIMKNDLKFKWLDMD